MQHHAAPLSGLVGDQRLQSLLNSSTPTGMAGWRESLQIMLSMQCTQKSISSQSLNDHRTIFTTLHARVHATLRGQSHHSDYLQTHAWMLLQSIPTNMDGRYRDSWFWASYNIRPHGSVIVKNIAAIGGACSRIKNGVKCIYCSMWKL